MEEKNNARLNDKGIKMIIVGVDKVPTLQLPEIIQASGHKESAVVIVENSDNIQQLACELDSLHSKAGQQLLAIEKIEFQKCDSKNVQKQESQQGWKNRPKHKR